MSLELIREIEQAFSLRNLQDWTYTLAGMERNGGSYDAFDASTKYIMESLKKAGFANVQRIAHPADGVTSAYDCIMPQAWDLAGRSTLTIVEGEVPEYERVLADTAVNPIHALIWSAPTPAGGVTCELVDYDTLDKEHPNVKGKWVLYNQGDGSDLDGSVYRTLALAGAAGLAVSNLAPIDDAPDELAWVNGQGLNGWYHAKEDPRLPVFSLAPRRALTLAEELRHGRIMVHAEMNTRIHDGEIYTVTAVIPGESSEEYALIAHVYEPFAGDDAQGFAAICELGRLLVSRGIRLKKTLRVIICMELYGLAAYLAVPEHRRDIIAGFNMDAFTHTSSNKTAFRHSPVFNAACTDWFFTDWFKRYLPDCNWTREWGSLSDDTFGGDPALDIPTNWIHTPCGDFHHNTGVFFVPDWRDMRKKLPVFAAALETLLTMDSFLDYSDTALHEYETRADIILADAKLSNHERKCYLDAEFMRQTGRLKFAERFDGRHRDAGKLLRAHEDRLAQVEALPCQEFNSAEYRALNLKVTAKVMGPPFSLARVPFAERRKIKGLRTLWPLFDGSRNLLECIRIMDCDSGHRTSAKEIRQVMETLRYTAKYGYNTLEESVSVSIADLQSGLDRLGVKAGMDVVVHSTFSSLGSIPGGAEAVCDVLQKRITEQGTLMMPTFTFQLYEGSRFGELFDVRNTPSDVGILSEVFRKRPGVLRSYDPCHSFAVWGRNARDFALRHHLVPTVSPHSPLGLLERADGWCLSISAGDAITFQHVVEDSNGATCNGVRTEEYESVLHDGRHVKLRTWGWRAKTCGKCPSRRPVELFEMMRKGGTLRETFVGNAHLMFFRLADYRAVYEELLKGVCGKDADAVPRTVSVTVPSDWDAERQCLRETTAYTGEYLGPLA
ncbi:MAG: AAC(3) family N-acetyltransferase [Victivallales bacterium]|nr:AAC(3) family N-acetyltransferase [Victivallales bacterium]